WSPVSSGGTAGGDLSGSYPNPTVARINGVTLGSTTATSGNLLIGNGTQWNSTAVTGDVTIDGTGATTIGALKVTNGMIASNAITQSKLATASVGTGEIINGGVGTIDIADNAVTGIKIALGSDATGDVMYYNGTDYVRLGIGTAGQVLTVNAGIPSWSPVSSGGTAGGDLSGSYPNPTVARINGVTLGTTTATNANLLIANGSQWNSVGLSGDATITNAGALTIGTGAITTTKIADNAVSGTKIALGSDATGDVMYYNGTDYVRLGIGSTNQVLSVVGGVPAWQTAGLQYFTESLNTASPNSVSAPVHQFAATGAGTDIDIALTPKGNGALTAQVANNSPSGGNKRGSRAVDWQTDRTDATQVANGLNSSIGGGRQNTASGDYTTVSGGINNQATGNGATVIGGQNGVAGGGLSVVLGGLSNTAAGNNSIASGVGMTMSTTAQRS
ncbi:MAG: hypothetical protein JNL32_16275, partial [Candidatus Kapabacteria bacterium]|nr:hypothetical protein [Candidatus Kapabacteria bacterium]